MKSRLLGPVCILLVFTTATPMLSNASSILIEDPIGGHVTSILGLDVQGILYDATFNETASFNTLWDQNGNNVFGDDCSVYASAPIFWGDKDSAEAAAIAILNALGSSAFTAYRFDVPTDTFYVPFRLGQVEQTVDAYRDDYFSAPIDEIVEVTSIPDTFALIGHPYVSFSAIPIPPALYLFGSGLLGLIGISRRKKA